jgi:hypothetical protein
MAGNFLSKKYITLFIEFLFEEERMSARQAKQKMVLKHKQWRYITRIEVKKQRKNF